MRLDLLRRTGFEVELLAPAGLSRRTLALELARRHGGSVHPVWQPAALANVVRLFAYWRQTLRTVLQTNPACRRPAALPAELLQAVEGKPSYEELQQAATAGELTKFFDVNLTQLLTDAPSRDTIEVRILPGAIDTEIIVQNAGLIELLLERCLDPTPLLPPPDDPEAAEQELSRWPPPSSWATAQLGGRVSLISEQPVDLATKLVRTPCTNCTLSTDTARSAPPGSPPAGPGADRRPERVLST